VPQQVSRLTVAAALLQLPLVRLMLHVRPVGGRLLLLCAVLPAPPRMLRRQPAERSMVQVHVMEASTDGWATACSCCQVCCAPFNWCMSFPSHKMNDVNFVI